MMILSVRHATVRLLLGCLVMAAMGVAQLLGLSRGFWCECAPMSKIVMEATCEPSVCHPHLDHVDECDEAVGHANFSKSQCDPAPCPGDGDHGDHRHQQVREAWMTTAVATVILLPSPAMYDLPPSVVVAVPTEWAGDVRRHARRAGWLSDGGPPTPVLVARTMVMLV